MRRITWIIAIVMCVTVFLAACGKKDAESVVKDLDHVVSKMASYQGAGKMTLYTGQQPQEYQVEVSYQQPHYYRIALTNAKKDITQIVLRNDEGVFVLTPHLNKSFRFQSNWPENQGQVYLYQTLVQSIISDNSRQFTTDKDAYVFDVVANYQSGSLARQKIWLNKSNYAPIQVAVSDPNDKVMVEVKFDKFEFDKAFDKDSFDMQRNMTSLKDGNVPTMAGTDEGQQTGTDTPLDSMDIALLEPAYIPEGVTSKAPSDIELGDKKGIMIRYTGTYNYTLFESRSLDRAVSFMESRAVNLGFTIGAMTGDEKKTLTWTNNGVEFRLSSDDLPEEEMVKIAQSMPDQPEK